MTRRRSRWQKSARFVLLVVRVGLGCIFIASSLPKICQPYDFLAGVYSYELVGAKMGILVAMILPWLELFVGICLVGGVLVGGALLVSIALGAMFSFVLASVLYRGLAISCGCFRPTGEQVIGYFTLLRASAILLSAVLGCGCLIVLQAGSVSGSRTKLEAGPTSDGTTGF